MKETVFFNELKKLNFGFHKPRKDDCNTCTKYRETKVKTPEIEQAHEEHLIRAKMARQLRDTDKAISKEDPTYLTVICDLEAVSHCPRAPASNFFYKSKINCYNFTIIDLATMKGYCYRWDQTIGLRGADEMTSARLHFYSHMMDKNVTEVVEYSDTCGGQNRSKFLSTSLCNFLQGSNVKKFTQKFFESGHSQSEVDTMHSSLEKRLKDKCIYRPEQWLEATREAGSVSGQKYEVFALGSTATPILDTRSLVTDVVKNVEVAIDLETGDEVKSAWMKAHRIVYGSGNGDDFTIKLHNSFSTDECGRTIDLLEKPTKGKNLRSSQPAMRQSVPQVLNVLVDSKSPKLPINVDIVKGLLELCKGKKDGSGGVIPDEYHSYYNSLNKTPDTILDVEYADVDDTGT